MTKFTLLGTAEQWLPSCRQMASHTLSDCQENKKGKNCKGELLLLGYGDFCVLSCTELCFIATPPTIQLLTIAHQSSCMVTALLDGVSPHSRACLLLVCYQPPLAQPWDKCEETAYFLFWSTFEKGQESQGGKPSCQVLLAAQDPGFVSILQGKISAGSGTNPILSCFSWWKRKNASTAFWI